MSLTFCVEHRLISYMGSGAEKNWTPDHPACNSHYTNYATLTHPQTCSFHFTVSNTGSIVDSQLSNLNGTNSWFDNWKCWTLQKFITKWPRKISESIHVFCHLCEKGTAVGAMFLKARGFLAFPINVCASACSTKIVNIRSYGHVGYSEMSDNQDSTVPWTYWKVLISIQQVWVLHLPQSSPYVRFGIPDMLEASECYCTQPQTWCTPRRSTQKVM